MYLEQAASLDELLEVKSRVDNLHVSKESTDIAVQSIETELIKVAEQIKERATIKELHEHVTRRHYEAAVEMLGNAVEKKIDRESFGHLDTEVKV